MHTLLKHLVPACSNKEVKPKPPKKRCTFFFGNPFFDQIFFSKTLILHHPLKTVHQKISKKPYFYRLKKNGQVIDPTMARLLTLLWPKYVQVIDPTAYIYIWVSPLISDAFGSQKPQYSPCLALKMAKTIPPESGGIFGWDVFFQYKNVVISPVLAIFLF